MIELKIKDYCHNCDLFEPECETIVMSIYTEENTVNTTIKCKRSNVCNQLAKRLEREYKK